MTKLDIQNFPLQIRVAQTMARLRDRHVPTERDELLQEHITRLLRVSEVGELTPFPVLFTAGQESRGVVLIEPSGGGKTTAIARTLDAIPALGTNPETGAPRVIRIEVESPVTQRSIAGAILRKLGVEHVAKSARVWELFELIRARIIATGTTMIVIDEAHDMFECRSAREIDDMLKLIKDLMKGESAVNVILSGTERLADITGCDPQVSRRFTKIIPKDLQIGMDNEDLTCLIEEYCGAAGLTLDPTGLVVSRLIHGSRRRFGRAIEITINAIERALLAEDSRLERQHFAEAWGMLEGCPWDKNVFVSPDWEAIKLDEEAKKFDDARKTRQRLARVKN